MGKAGWNYSQKFCSCRRCRSKLRNAGSYQKRQLDTYHLILAPTHACNLRCKHCYLPDHKNELLPREIALRILDEWSDIVLDERKPFQGIFHVKGGEPFVVPYFEDLMHRLIEVQS